MMIFLMIGMKIILMILNGVMVKLHLEIKTVHKELNQEQIGNLNILVEMMEKTIGLLLEKTFT